MTGRFVLQCPNLGPCRSFSYVADGIKGFPDLTIYLDKAKRFGSASLARRYAIQFGDITKDYRPVELKATP